jgi:hypothetical protein
LRPRPRPFATTMLHRFLSGTEALTTLRAALLRIRLHHSSVNAAPARFFWTTVPCRFLFRAEALHASCPGLRFRDLDDSAVNARPTGFPFAITASFFFGTVGVTSSCAAFLFG